MVASLLNFRLKTYPNLTDCSSGPGAKICIFLVSFERKHSEVCGNVYVGEYNTIDLAEENTRK